MNSEFAENALRPIDPKTVWPSTTSPTAANSNSHPAKNLAEMVLGYEPANRHDRRKAKKLLKAKKY